MTRAERRALALQLAKEHLETLFQIVRPDPEMERKMLGNLCGLSDALERAGDDGDAGEATAGVQCGCHGGGLPSGAARYKKSCPRCGGSGTVPIAGIRERAQALVG